MNLFTVEQYDKAIENLKEARKQLIDGVQGKVCCGVCGGNCHPDMCGHNPLYAQYLCNQFSQQSQALHITLHRLSGFDTYMGEPVGIARVVSPQPTSNKE